MASRRTQEYQEESDEESEDEDYAPNEEDYARFEEDFALDGEDFALDGEDFALDGADFAFDGEDFALDGEDSEDSEEEHRETEIAPSEWPEIEIVVVPSGGIDGTEEWGGGDGEEDNEHNVVTENGCSTSGGRENDVSTSGNDGQFGTCLDSSCLPSCPICFIPWTSDGPHRVCCVPCGHVYGRSCLERWINQLKKTTAKCPQCSARFKKNEMINLYAPIIAVPNTDLEKEVLLLREKNESLKVERDLLMEEINRAKRISCLEASSTGALKRSSMHLNEGSIYAEPLLENNLKSQNDLNINGSSHHRCVLQNELPVDGARVLGIDACSQILIVSGKKPGHGGEHILSKISLLGRHEFDQIQLPPRTGAVRDLCILPGSLALIASLGKKISVLSMLSNNIVLKYDLPVPAWSCSGDVNEPYHIYAGLQNGMLMMFDIRQTARWLESIEGLSRFPIHTICSLQQNHCSRKVLTASSAGPCLWDASGCGERSFLIPGLENQGICISLATGCSNGEIVASFRPKIELPGDTGPSQTPVSPSQPIYSAGKLGSHVNIKMINGTNFQIARAVSGYVSEVRMSKSAIICPEQNNPLFAFGDESTHGACLWNLPSFQVHSRHRPHQYPILDLKYSSSGSSGFLGCLSENKLQIFTGF